MKKLFLYSGSLALVLLFAGCTNENPVTPIESGDGNTQETTTVETSTETNQSTDSIPLTFDVTLAEAIEVFQEKHPDTDITSIEVDSSFGNYFYKIEGMDDDTEYELKVDVHTKEVSEEKSEKLDRDEQNGVKRQEDKLDLSDLLPLDEITTIAEEQAEGGQATDWELDKEMGIVYWDVQVEEGRTETNVKINAKTGEVLEVELDD